MLKFPSTTCSCGDPFDLETAIDKVYKNKMDYLIREASIRLNSIVLITCYQCLGSVSLLKKPQNFEHLKITSDTHKITDYIEEDDKKMNGRNTHIICHKCYENNNSMEKLKGKMIFFCNICELNHYVDQYDIKKIKIKRDSNCCTIF